MPDAGNPQRKTLGRDLFVALLCGALVALTGGITYAALPFFSWLCRTGEVGGAKLAAASPWQPSPHLVTVRFDTGVDRPQCNGADAQARLVTASFRLTNQAGRISVGPAGYGIGSRRVCFEKINGLCFARQTMQPRHSVVLCVGRGIAVASGRDDVSTIRLFYTFYTVPAPIPAAQRARPPASGPGGI